MTKNQHTETLNNTVKVITLPGEDTEGWFVWKLLSHCRMLSHCSVYQIWVKSELIFTFFIKEKVSFSEVE